MDFYAFEALHDKHFSSQVLERWKEILQSNAFVEGHYNKSFEERFARLQGAEHCLLVGNGTDALEISLLARGIGVGDKIGVPGITFHATVEAVVNIGATPVLIDVEPTTGLMAPASLERILAEHELKGIMPVHIYGLPAPMEELEKLCLPLGIHIIEDAAQAQGTFYGDTEKPVGSRRNLATFSFYPTKNLGGMGDAGCILTQDDNLAKGVRSLRNHGRGGNRLGRNSRCDHLQAAVLDLKLTSIEGLNVRRKEIARNYYRDLEGVPLGLVPERYLSFSSWHLFPVRLKNLSQAERLRVFLREKGVATMDFYARALSQEPWAEGLRGECEEAEAMAGRVVCLPIHPFLRDEDIAWIVGQVGEFFED